MRAIQCLLADNALDREGYLYPKKKQKHKKTKILEVEIIQIDWSLDLNNSKANLSTTNKIHLRYILFPFALFAMGTLF